MNMLHANLATLQDRGRLGCRVAPVGGERRDPAPDAVLMATPVGGEMGVTPRQAHA